MVRVRRTFTVGAIALAAIAGPVIALAPAGATTTACVTHDSGFCVGQQSVQSAPLEMAVSVPISQVKAGTTVVGMGAAFSGREDWDFRPPTQGGSGTGGPDKIIRFAPGGVPRNLCLTANLDIARSRPRLETCMPGAAGSSHQIWMPEDNRGDGSVTWVNLANGLALTIVGDFQGAAIQIRSVGTGTGTNKNFVSVTTAP